MVADDESFENRLSHALSAHVDAHTGERSPEMLTRRVMTNSAANRRGFSPVWIALTAALALLVVAVASWAIFRPGVVPGNGSSAASATVRGAEYRVSVALDLVGEPVLRAYAPYEATSVPDWFADESTFELVGVDPSAVLVAHSANRPHEDGRFRLLWGPNEAQAFPALCIYLAADLRAAMVECK